MIDVISKYTVFWFLFSVQLMKINLKKYTEPKRSCECDAATKANRQCCFQHLCSKSLTPASLQKPQVKKQTITNYKVSGDGRPRRSPCRQCLRSDSEAWRAGDGGEERSFLNMHMTPFQKPSHLLDYNISGTSWPLGAFVTSK
jgi:hypothetical protein